MIYQHLLQRMKANKPLFALLIDPDKHTPSSLNRSVEAANQAQVDWLLVGGSLVTSRIDQTIDIIKKQTDIPVILFPGSLLQVSDKADGILFLSLISGRNPDLLIGMQVLSAPILKDSGMEILPTGYILVDTGRCTSVEYISNTKPVPYDKPSLAMATALAGEMLGLRLIYMDAGSGAEKPISQQMIREVRQELNVPLIVGGGLRTANDMRKALEAGADVLVVGTAAEENIDKLNEFSSLIHNFTRNEN